MTAYSLRHHMERFHSIVLPHTREVDFGGVGSDTYVVSFPHTLKSVDFLLEGCPSRANTSEILREHFMYRHWKVKVAVVQEVPAPLPWCDQCEMHIPASRLFNHRHMDKCNKATERYIMRIDVEMAARCSDMEFSLYGEEGGDVVEVVENFRYLGRTLDQMDDDFPEVSENIMCARSVWGRLGMLLRW